MMSNRLVLNVSNGGPWNPKLTIKINNLWINSKLKTLQVRCWANMLSKSEGKEKMIFWSLWRFKIEFPIARKKSGILTIQGSWLWVLKLKKSKAQLKLCKTRTRIRVLISCCWNSFQSGGKPKPKQSLKPRERQSKESVKLKVITCSLCKLWKCVQTNYDKF